MSLEQLIDCLSKIDLTDNSEMATNSGTVNVAPASVNIPLLKLYVDMIPFYNGNPNTLTQFVSSCDLLFSTFGQTLDQQIKLYLTRVVQSKLVDRANLLVGSRIELNDWVSIKNALLQCFGDKRSLECLEQDLLMAHPYKNEPPLEFAKRLQVLKSQLAQKINNLSRQVMDDNTKAIHLRQYDTMTLRTLIRNLSGTLQQTIRLKNPNNIETAISNMIEEENFLNYQNNFKNTFSNGPAKPNSVKPQSQTQMSQNYQQFRQPPQNNHFQPSYRPFQPQFQYSNNFQPPYQYSNNFFRRQNEPPKFPSQPIHVQPRPVKQHFPTHSQVFGKPKNVFAPTGKKPDHKPEPMSTTSTYTLQKKQQPPRQNYFSPTGPPNFYFEELHNLESDSNYYENYEDHYSSNSFENSGQIDENYQPYFDENYHTPNENENETSENEQIPNENFQSVPNQDEVT